ncbi:diguanylate cyclase domain-containing protein [Cryptosporangium sp. NPDC048952]|uniref:diguanylate cyclase domain-containing protein n=1 Tax=Cryptosporangium sp. NPDC048952 TaxID=3363961 RepID=UPI00371CB0FB
MRVQRPKRALRDQALERERAVAEGAARLAAVSDRDVVQSTAVETAAAIARSGGAKGVRVMLGIGHDLRHEIVATAGERTASAIGRTVEFDELPEHLVAALRRGEAIYLERQESDLAPRRGGVLVIRLRAGGRDVGALSVAANTPLSPQVRAAISSWSSQVAASLAGLALTEELLHRAYHDPLTGLANRDLLRQRLESALHEGHADGFTAFLLLDLDRFGQITATLGPRAGDDVLCAVADRLRSMVGPGDVAARLGAEEFGLVLGGVLDADAATAVAERLIGVLRAPITADGHTVTIGGSIGVALRAPGTGASFDEIVDDADAAMGRARQAAGPVRRLSVAS